MHFHADASIHRLAFVKIYLNDVVILLCGVYAPSLNSANMDRRYQFREECRILLSEAFKRPGLGVVFGGDINEVPSWHVPRIPEYASEGYPMHQMLADAGLADLNAIHVGPGVYSWTSTRGDKQLLDGAHLNDVAHQRVNEYALDESLLKLGLTDHSGIRMILSGEPMSKSVLGGC